MNIKKVFLPILLMPSLTYSLVTYQVVTIGDPGNANDITGFGQVDYLYKIGIYQVTIAQYTEFLNAVAATDDNDLYNSCMTNVKNIAGVARDGSEGNYTYSAIGSANRPIACVSWFSAARFANWMSNGQPQGAQNSTTTENGAYNLQGITNYAVRKNLINPNTGLAPTFFIPTENEWYKAAYYNGSGGYYLYATQSNNMPGNSIGSSLNQANYFSNSTGFSITQTTTFDPNQNYLVDVGSYIASNSYYGTFDQTGNLWEWNDFDGEPARSRGLRGCAYFSTEPFIDSYYRVGYDPAKFGTNSGFRLAGPQ